MRRKLRAILLTMIAAVNILGTVNVFAAPAGDYQDKIFSFYISSYGKERDTDSYPKYNTSSVYIYLTDSETDYAKVQAYGKINGAWSNETVGTRKYGIVTIGKQRLRTNIVEHGGSGTYTKLHFCYYIEPTVNIGVWSPDCAGSYPAVN